MKIKIEEYTKEIIEKYLTGKYSCQNLAEEYGTNRKRIEKLLKKFNIKKIIRRKYTLNQNYFDIIDTEGKAYFLGLLYADGCNYADRPTLAICLQERDKAILEIFNTELASNIPLYYRDRQKIDKVHKNIYELRINSKYMCEQLTKLGCIPLKSLTLKFPTEKQVPLHLMHHFIRGYMDGDGCINSYLPNNSSKKACSVSFSSTLYFCQSIADFLLSTLHINGRIALTERAVTHNTSSRVYRVSGNNQSLILLDWIYKDATIFIERKFLQYQEIKKYLLDYQNKKDKEYMDRYNGIINSHNQGKSKKEIAMLHNCSITTVTKYLSQYKQSLEN